MAVGSRQQRAGYDPNAMPISQACLKFPQSPSARAEPVGAAEFSLFLQLSIVRRRMRWSDFSRGIPRKPRRSAFISPRACIDALRSMTYDLRPESWWLGFRSRSILPPGSGGDDGDAGPRAAARPGDIRPGTRRDKSPGDLSDVRGTAHSGFLASSRVLRRSTAPSVSSSPSTGEFRVQPILSPAQPLPAREVPIPRS